jgi:glycosyltransferase involved in cell wall biosynthesis
LTVLRNIYTEYHLIPPPFNILILIQKYPFEKYFKSQNKIVGIDFIVVNDINGKIKRGIFEQFLVPYWAIKKKVDAIYMPATFSLFFKVKPILLFFHVSVSFILPQKYIARSKFQAFLHNFIIKRTSEKCDLIHCTTQQTRKELLGYINYNSDNITVNYNGITPKEVKKVQETEISFEINAPFILCVSQFYRLKNQDTVISSFIKFKNEYIEYKNYKLVLVGAIQEKDFFDELISLSAEYPDDIIFLHNISDSHLEYLYCNCSIYVFLSILEGFGLTPCEALFYNKTLLLSDIPTLQEIYGEYATFVDPYDLNKISREMKTLIDEPRENNIDLTNLYDKFNWSKFVNILDRDLLKIIHKKL